MGRKSVRKYLPKPVEKEKIEVLLKAGMAAPSGKDVRPKIFSKASFVWILLSFFSELHAVITKKIKDTISNKVVFI